jgi:hypothetical protein
MKRLSVKVFVALISLSIPFSAYAQTIGSLTSIDGSVFLRRAGETIPVTEVVDVSDGDVILVKEDSSARIVYSNGCEEELGPNTLKKIEDLPSCDTGMKSDADGTQTALIVGGAVVILGGAALLLSSDGGNDHGNSP